MRRIQSTCFTVLLGLIICCLPERVASQTVKNKKDPFTREAGKGKEPGQIEEGFDNVVLGFQLIEVPQKAVFKWEQEGLNWSVWHDNANKLIDDGDAKLLVSTSMVARSGQRSQVASRLRLPYPTESEVLEIDPKGPPFPTSFATRDLGLILMADPVLHAGSEKLSLNYSLEWSGYDGENFEARPVSDRIQNTDVISPKFRTKKVSNSIDLEIGVYRMLTQFEGGDPANVMLVFARYNLVTAAPLQDKSKMAGLEGLRFRSYWIEMKADLWHDWLRRGSLATLYGGSAWDKVREQIEVDGPVKIVAAPTLVCRSGQRAKIEAVKEQTSPSDFSPPKVLGGVSESASQEKESIGATFEVDPVLGVDGITDLNFVANLSSVCGSAVSFRHEENGKWVPSISQLKIFEDRITTTVSLDKDMKILAATMTPANEDGSLDYSRKLLFFIHNNTFQDQ